MYSYTCYTVINLLNGYKYFTSDFDSLCKYCNENFDLLIENNVCITKEQVISNIDLARYLYEDYDEEGDIDE